MTPDQLDSVGKKFLNLLMIIMALRIASYFTLFPSSIGLTRVAKIGLRFILTGVVFYLLMLWKSRHRKIRFEFKMALPLALYLGYLLLGVLSLFWSTGIGYSALQLAMTIETMVFSYLYFQLLILYERAYQIERSLYSRILARATLYIGIAFIIGLFVNPSLFFRGTHGGAVQRLGGYIINPNELGMLAVLGAAMAFIELLATKKGQKFNYFIAVVCLVVLLLTQSRSSLGAFALVAGLYILLMDNYFIKVSAIVVGVLTTPVILNTIVFKEGNVEEVMSMTGRLPFWQDLIEVAFQERPLFGFGFMRISPSTFTDKFGSIHSYAAAMTHNTFVQVLINLGLAGAFVVLLQMVVTFYAIYIDKDKWLRLMAGLSLIPLLINSMTEFGIFGETNYGILFYQFVIMLFTLRAIQVKQIGNDFLHRTLNNK